MCIRNWIEKRIPGWRSLKRFGKNKTIISSYIWIIIVPIAAKLIPELRDFFYTQDSLIKIQLPFSWELFYYSAICFSFSSLIFSIQCPFINDRYENPLDAKNGGYSINQLDSYFHSKTSIEKEKYKVIINKYQNIERDENEYNDKFWIVHREFSKRRLISRFFCTLGYFVGFVFIAVILFQNFIYVWG